MISIIIRTKNEERWITPCLEAIKRQTLKDVEIILVDNGSTDQTVAKAKTIYPTIKVVKINKFIPGLAINKGIRASRGEYLVCLSAHCIPVENTWLEKLLKNLKDEKIAGVYGRQIPMSFTSPADARDLIITFGLDARTQIKDPFFHNANSMFRRDIWEKIPFDEKLTNIEDRKWGQNIIAKGYKIRYEPEAAVYHHHGIHQSNNKNRAKGTIKVLSTINDDVRLTKKAYLNPSTLKIVAIIPLRESNKNNIDLHNELIQKTINSVKESEYIDDIFVTTDSKLIAKKVTALGITNIIYRPVRLSRKNVRVDEVLQYTLKKIEHKGLFPDLIVPLEITYPFRPVGLIDKLIEELLENGLDTVISGKADYRPSWIVSNDEFVRLDDHLKIRDERSPLYIGLPSLGCVTHSQFIREGTRIGGKVGIYNVTDVLAATEIRNKKDYQNISKSLQI